MAYSAPVYPDLVQDLLTTLTGGTVREGLVVPDDAQIPIRLPLLANRPVRRISHVQGTTLVGRPPNQQPVDVVFTDADYELVSTADDGTLDSLRFRPRGRQPAPRSVLIVNYYPATVPPVPVTDLNVGSVVRTLVETVSLELALMYQQLDQVYKSAFVGTANGSSLDEVVRLVGVTRTPGGAPAVVLTFTRQAGAATARLTVPAGTAVTDAKGNRYRTADDLDLEPGELGRTVIAFGESAATPVADAAALTRLEVAIVGIASVTNDKPAYVLDSPEADDDLRRRARRALHSAVRGTLDSLVTAVENVPGVQRVTATEPADRPGVVHLDVAYSNETDTAKQAVADAILAFRPAGIKVEDGPAARVPLTVNVAMTIAGAVALSSSDAAALQTTISTAIGGYLTSIPPGGQIRRARLSSLAMQDPRVADATIALSWPGGSGEELSLPDGQVASIDHIGFAPLALEAGTTATGSSTVDATLPVVLGAGTAAAAVTTAVTAALTVYLGARDPQKSLTVASLAIAIRDDSLFTLVRSGVTLTVRSGGRFVQLTDLAGDYVPQAGERLTLGQLTVTPSTGGGT
jgi:uncharacterized phage protein gp47/JayE